MPHLKLKLLAVIAVLGLCCALPQARAQSVYFDFKFGAFYPAELPGGLFPNFALHKSIDRDGVLQWDVGVGAGYYRRSYRDLAYVATAVPSAVEEINFTRRVVPLQIKLSMKISLIEMNLPNFPGTRTIARRGMSGATSLKDLGFVIRPYVAYFKLNSEEENPESNVSAARTYKDWGWGSEFGIYLSTVSNVTTTISVLYNRAALPREESDAVEDAGLPVAEEVKLHGYGFLLSLGWGF